MDSKIKPLIHPPKAVNRTEASLSGTKAKEMASHGHPQGNDPTSFWMTISCGGR